MDVIRTIQASSIGALVLCALLFAFSPSCLAQADAEMTPPIVGVGMEIIEGDAGWQLPLSSIPGFDTAIAPLTFYFVGNPTTLAAVSWLEVSGPDAAGNYSLISNAPIPASAAPVDESIAPSASADRTYSFGINVQDSTAFSANITVTNLRVRPELRTVVLSPSQERLPSAVQGANYAASFRANHAFGDVGDVEYEVSGLPEGLGTRVGIDGSLTIAGTPTRIEESSVTVTASDLRLVPSTMTVALSVVATPPSDASTPMRASFVHNFGPANTMDRGMDKVNYSSPAYLTLSGSGAHDAATSVIWTIISGAPPSSGAGPGERFRIVSYDELTPEGFLERRARFEGLIKFPPASAPTTSVIHTVVVRALINEAADPSPPDIALQLEILPYRNPLRIIYPAGLNPIMNTTMASAVIGEPYTDRLDVQFGVGPFVWSAEGLPPGLSLSGDGTISGTPLPQTTANHAIVVSVHGEENRPNNATTKTMYIEVGAPPLAITTAALPIGYVDHIYDPVLLTAQGGTGIYQWSVIDGPSTRPLPLGLRIEQDSAGVWQLLGTPEASATGNYNIQLEVRDNNTPQAVASVVLPLQISPSVTLLTTNLPAAVVGEAYDADLMLIGGVPPYTVEWMGAPLTGFSLEVDGISGTWSIHADDVSLAFGVHPLRLAFYDSDTPPQEGETYLPLTVQSEEDAATLQILNTYLPPAVSDETYDAVVFRASGGNAPYTWTATGLPDGLTLYPNGMLTGTVEADAGEYTITVQARDLSATPLVATANYLLIVTAGSTAAVTGDDSTPASSAGLSSALVGAAAAGCSMSGSDGGLMMLAVLIFLASMTALRVRAARHAGARVSSNTGRNTA